MGKSKNLTVFELENGRRAVFNQVKFKYTVNQKAEELNRKNRTNRGGKEEIFRMIANGISCSPNPDILDSTKNQVKHWYRGDNGPRSIDDIFKLADIFECDNREAFLKEIEKTVEESQMNTPKAEMVNVNIDQGKIIRAMRIMKEKEVAYELYSSFVDLMGTYLKADLAVWFEYEEGTPEWKAALASFPKRMPVECAIQKAKMYISEDTVLRAYNLLEEMYGPRYDEVEEPSDFKNDIHYLLSGFRMQRLDMFDNFLNDKRIEKGEEYSRDDNWNDFMMELHHDWWHKLEEAFEDYLP